MTHPTGDRPDSRPPTVRVALCQLHFHPATVYRFEPEILQPLREPVYVHSYHESLACHILGAFSGTPGEEQTVKDLRDAIRDAYFEFLRRRLTFILDLCRTWQVELVVFPEYAVPGELLLGLEDSARGLNVVFGSHQVTRFLVKEGLYSRLGQPEVKPGDAVAPVLTQDRRWTIGAHYLPGKKLYWPAATQDFPARYEPSGQEAGPFVTLPGGMRLLVLPDQNLESMEFPGDSLRKAAANANIVVRLFSPPPMMGSGDTMSWQQHNESYVLRALPSREVNYCRAGAQHSPAFPVMLSGESFSPYLERIGVVDLERDLLGPTQPQRPYAFNQVNTFHLMPSISLPMYQQTTDTFRSLPEEDDESWLETQEQLLEEWSRQLAYSQDKAHRYWRTRINRLLDPHLPCDHAERMQILTGFVPLPPDCPTAVELDWGLALASDLLLGTSGLTDKIELNQLYDLVKRTGVRKPNLETAPRLVQAVATEAQTRFSKEPHELDPLSRQFRLAIIGPLQRIQASLRVSNDSADPAAQQAVKQELILTNLSAALLDNPPRLLERLKDLPLAKRLGRKANFDSPEALEDLRLATVELIEAKRELETGWRERLAIGPKPSTTQTTLAEDPTFPSLSELPNEAEMDEKGELSEFSQCWLREVTLTHFKAAFEPKPIPLSPFTVLIGRNGSGKSTLLEALQWIDRTIREDAHKASSRYHRVRDLIHFLSPAPASFRIGLRWEVSLPDHEARPLKYDLEVREDPEKQTPVIASESLKLLSPEQRWIHTSSRDGTRVIHPDDPAFQFLVPEPDRLALGRVFRHFWEGAVFLRLSPSLLAHGSSPYRSSYEPLLDEEGRTLPALLNELSPEQRKDLSATLKQVLPDIDGVNVSATSGNREEIVHYSLQEEMGATVDERNVYEVPAWMLSEGTRRITAILALLVRSPAPTLLCIEEIENGLDPWTVLRVLDELKSAADRGTQIIITTHSPWLLDHVQLEDIIQVRRHDGETIYERFADRREVRDYSDSVPPGTIFVQEIE